MIGYGAISRAAEEVADKLKQIAGLALEAAPEDIELQGRQRDRARRAGEGDADDDGRLHRVLRRLRRRQAPAGHRSCAHLDPLLRPARDVRERLRRRRRRGRRRDRRRHGRAGRRSSTTAARSSTRWSSTASSSARSRRASAARSTRSCATTRTATSWPATCSTTSTRPTLEIPPIEVGHLQTPSPVTEGGVKGCGEGGTIATPAAVVNAVADALDPARRDRRAHAARPEPRAVADPGGSGALMDQAEARRRVGTARVARLGTLTPDGRLHLVPMCFALDGGTLYTAIDAKPKRSRALTASRERAREPGRVRPRRRVGRGLVAAVVGAPARAGAGARGRRRARAGARAAARRSTSSTPPTRSAPSSRSTSRSGAAGRRRLSSRRGEDRRPL